MWTAKSMRNPAPRPSRFYADVETTLKVFVCGDSNAKNRSKIQTAVLEIKKKCDFGQPDRTCFHSAKNLLTLLNIRDKYKAPLQIRGPYRKVHTPRPLILNKTREKKQKPVGTFSKSKSVHLRSMAHTSQESSHNLEREGRKHHT